MPQITPIMTATCSSNRRTGIKKVKANRNLDKKVDIVAVHICASVWTFSASSEIWIPSESEKASAMAIVNIPPRTTLRELVPDCSPIIKPMVVMTPEVIPKLNPVISESFIYFRYLIYF